MMKYVTILVLGLVAILLPWSDLENEPETGSRQVFDSPNWRSFAGKYELEGDGIFSKPIEDINWLSIGISDIERHLCPEYARLHPDSELFHLVSVTHLPAVTTICEYIGSLGNTIQLRGSISEANAYVDEQAAKLCVNWEVQTLARVWQMAVVPDRCASGDGYGMLFYTE